MLAMAKATNMRRAVAIPTEDKVKLRRRAGAVEFYDEKAGRWVAVPTVPGLLDRLRSESKIDDEEFQAGVRFSMRFEAAGLGVPVGPEVVPRVDRVHLRRGGVVGARVEPLDPARARHGREQPAGLVGQAVVGVADHLRPDRALHLQHEPRG